MDKPWLIKDIADCSATDTVIVVISNKRQRTQITQNLGKLGDRVVDYYDQDQIFAIDDFFFIPHRLMVLSYRDYSRIREKVSAHLATSDKYAIPPILVFGRWWRKLPVHPALIDGDNTSPDALYKMYWEARGYTYTGLRGEPICS